MQQTKDVAINGLFPDALARGEVTAHQSGINARIERGRVKGNQAAFTVTGDADPSQRLRCLLRYRGVQLDEPIDHRDNLLHFVTDDVAAHFVGLAVNPFAMRLVGEPTEQGIAGTRVVAIDQDGHDDLTAVFREAAGELRFGRKARLKPREHLRCLVRIGKGNHASQGVAFGLEKKALTIDILEHRPAHGVGAKHVRFSKDRQCRGAAHVFQGSDAQPRVNRSYALLEPVAVGSNRFLVSFA